MDTTHILACLDFLAAQATRGVEVTGDGDTKDVRANAAVVRRVIEELAKKKPHDSSWRPCRACGSERFCESCWKASHAGLVP